MFQTEIMLVKSYKQSLTTFISNVMCAPGYWYSVMITSDPSISFAALLGVTSDEFFELFGILGLIKITSNKTPQFQSKKFESFLQENWLGEVQLSQYNCDSKKTWYVWIGKKPDGCNMLPLKHYLKIRPPSIKNIDCYQQTFRDER